MFHGREALWRCLRAPRADQRLLGTRLQRVLDPGTFGRSSGVYQRAMRLRLPLGLHEAGKLVRVWNRRLCPFAVSDVPTRGGLLQSKQHVRLPDTRPPVPVSSAAIDHQQWLHANGKN